MTWRVYIKYLRVRVRVGKKELVLLWFRLGWQSHQLVRSSVDLYDFEDEALDLDYIVVDNSVQRKHHYNGSYTWGWNKNTSNCYQFHFCLTTKNFHIWLKFILWSLRYCQLAKISIRMKRKNKNFVSIFLFLLTYTVTYIRPRLEKMNSYFNGLLKLINNTKSRRSTRWYKILMASFKTNFVLIIINWRPIMLNYPHCVNLKNLMPNY